MSLLLKELVVKRELIYKVRGAAGPSQGVDFSKFGGALQIEEKSHYGEGSI
jgi:hypothetical protein